MFITVLYAHTHRAWHRVCHCRKERDTRNSSNGANGTHFLTVSFLEGIHGVAVCFNTQNIMVIAMRRMKTESFRFKFNPISFHPPGQSLRKVGVDAGLLVSEMMRHSPLDSTVHDDPKSTLSEAYCDGCLQWIVWVTILLLARFTIFTFQISLANLGVCLKSVYYLKHSVFITNK